jgi:hypothetical protein
MIVKNNSRNPILSPSPFVKWSILIGMISVNKTRRRLCKRADVPGCAFSPNEHYRISNIYSLNLFGLKNLAAHLCLIKTRILVLMVIIYEISIIFTCILVYSISRLGGTPKTIPWHTCVSRRTG